MIIITIHPQAPNHITPKRTAGIPQTKGPIYGTISKSPKIKANDALWGISIPKRLNIHKDTYIVIPIYKDNKSLDFNQIPNFL
jgi:hypothetical protein